MVMKGYFKVIGFVFVLIMSAVLIGMAAAPSINFNEPPTPASGSTVTVNYVNISVTLGESGTALLKWGSNPNISMIGSGTSYYYNKTLSNGNYSYIVYANDTTPGNWTPSGTRTVNVNVPASAPAIVTYKPSTASVSTVQGVPQKFNVTMDQIANVSWKINGGQVQFNTSVPIGTKAEYVNSTAGLGTYTVTATASNDNGSSSPQTWTWNVITSPGPDPVTGLIPASRGTTWINWSWVNPGGNFNYSMVKINGTFQTNTSKNYYNYTQFSIGTLNTISLQTVDTSGVVNSTVVSNQSYTLNTPTGTNVQVSPVANLNVIFSQVNNEGNTSANVYSSLQSGWGNHSFSKIGNYYDITADSVFYSGNITVELGYTPTSGINESNIKLYHWNGASWDALITNVDTTNKKVSGNVTSLSPFVVGAPPGPVITRVAPDANSIENMVNEAATFKITVDQYAGIAWKIDSSIVNSTNSTPGVNISYTNSNTPSGNHTVSVTASNVNGTATLSWTWLIRPKTYLTGNRIWDGGKPSDYSLKYTWTPMSFYAFYYDLDSNLGTESLQITLNGYSNRGISRGNLQYSTTPNSVQFKQSKWGSYDVIGFMADRYFAGYTSNTSRDITSSRISTLDSKQLHRVITDDDTQRVVSSGSTLTLSEGYVLKFKDVDAAGRIVLFSLLKDGGEIESTPVSQGGTYVYKKRVGTVNDLPIIAARVESVFSGRETSAAFIKGIFQLSESYTSANTGNRYGIMEITDASSAGIKMENRDSFTLSQGSTIDVMGDVKFIVADNSSVLRFAPMVKKSGTYEVRGTIAGDNDTQFNWNPMNFEGFYYNLKEDIGTETLSLTRAGRTISRDNLVYTATPQPVSFKYSNFGKFKVIGFMADKYFSGYIGCPGCITTNDINTIGYRQLHRVLIDDDTQRVIYAGSTLTLNEGYVIKIKDVNIGAGTAEVWLTLLKDGNEIFDDIKAPGQIFKYAPSKVGNVNDLPIIAVRIESIFRGREATAAFAKGVFQISEKYTTVNQGDRYGIMEVGEISDTRIQMTNPSSLSLSSASTIDVMGNIKFKVANSQDVRFYPFITVNGTVVAENQLAIGVPDSLMVRDTITIAVTAGSGTPIENAEVSFDNEVIGNTNSTGKLDYMLTRSGTHNFTATKLGYEKAIKTVSISEYRDITLKFELPTNLDQGIPIDIKVVSNGTAMAGANVTFDGASIGVTNSNGILNHTFDVSGTHNLGASKPGYISVLREITVRAPFTEFKALDINITPAIVHTNEKYFVWSNITNSGTKAGMLPVSLIVNSTVVESKNVTLDPGATQEVNFTRKMELPPGNYSIEILEQKKIVQVIEEPLNIYLVVVIISALVAGGMYLFTTPKGNEVIGLLKEKFSDLVQSVKR